MRSLFLEASAGLFRSCLITALAGAGFAIAQEGEPPRARLDRGMGFGAAPAGHAAHGLAPGAVAPDLCPMGDVCYDLAIGYVTGRIRNPAFSQSDPRGFDQVKLRGYVGEVLDPGGQIPFMAPVVELAPGDTFRLTLNNKLPSHSDMKLPGKGPGGDPLTCADTATDHNDTHCAHFNLTNMHTHGLWVSPLGNSDNVLLTINPEVSFTYEYNIPSDHPAGTFWYHAHRHGSTGPQLASGMAGALIIRGGRQPVLVGDTWAGAGDIDVLLSTSGPGPVFPERLMLFQQIAYACRDDDGRIKPPTGGPWVCDPSDVGGVEPGPNDAFDQLTPSSWAASQRHTAINGEVQKTMAPAVARTVERWRLIHGGVRQSIQLQIRRAEDPAALEAFLARGMELEAAADQVARICSGGPLEVTGLATDGLTRPALHPRTATWLQPGYREDILVSFPEEGTYCLVNADIAGGNAVNAQESEPALLGTITVVAPDAPLPDATPSERVLASLIASAEAQITDATVRNRVIADLKDGGGLRAFVKHRDIAASEVTGQETVGFNIQAPPLQFTIGEIEQDFIGSGGLSLVGAAPYDPSKIHRLLPLGQAQQWSLTSFGGGGHPFHIHVNPFQIMSVRVYRPLPGCFQRQVGGNPTQTVPVDTDNRPGCNAKPTDISTWVDVSVPGSLIASGPLQPDGSGGLAPSQHAGLKGAWKDTIFTPQGQLVQFRTRYERYIGDFVLHCHILDHEDQGMMQNVRIALTDGKGGFDIPMTEDHAH